MGQTIITEDGRFEWDEAKNAQNDEEYPMYINYYLRKVMDMVR